MSATAAKKSKPAVTGTKRKETASSPAPAPETKTVANKRQRTEPQPNAEFKSYVPPIPTAANTRRPPRKPRRKVPKFKFYSISDVKAEQMNLNLKKNHPNYFSSVRLSDWAVTLTKKGNIFICDTGNSSSSSAASVVGPFANVRRCAIWEYGDNKIDNPDSKYGALTYDKAKTWIQLTNESLHAFDSDSTLLTNPAMDEFFEWIELKVVPWFVDELFRLKPEKFKDYFEKAEKAADERINMIKESNGTLSKSRDELIKEMFRRTCISPCSNSSKEGGIARMNCSSWVFGIPFNMTPSEKEELDFSACDDGGVRQDIWLNSSKVYTDLPLVDIHTRNVIPLEDRIIPSSGAALSISFKLDVSEDEKTKTIGLKFSPTLIYIAGVNDDHSREQVNTFYSSIGDAGVKEGAKPVGDVVMINDEDDTEEYPADDEEEDEDKLSDHEREERRKAAQEEDKEMQQQEAEAPPQPANATQEEAAAQEDAAEEEQAEEEQEEDAAEEEPEAEEEEEVAQSQ